jgi:spermidine/putrescine-binding protein
MSEDEKKVNVNSAEFKRGVEAGLNSEEDTKNWKAGNELGRELKEEGETAEPDVTREEL